MKLYTFDGRTVRRKISFQVEYVFEGEPLVVEEEDADQIEELCAAASSCFVEVEED